MLLPWMKWFAQEQWTIGLVKQSIKDIINKGITQPIQWLPPLDQGFIADPHAMILPDGRFEILAEQFDYGSFKGRIVSTTASPDQFGYSPFSPIVELSTHFSYPQTLVWGAEQLLFCENWEQGGIPIFARSDVKQPWQYRTTILKDQRVVDPTPFFYEGIFYLFFTLQDDHPNESLRIMYSSNPLSAWQLHPQKRICDDIAGARSAGPIIQLSDGTLIRPGQDCTDTYGGAIVLHEITELSTNTYREKKMWSIEPQAGPWQWGLHTLCPMGNQHTLIDGKRWLYSPIELLRKLARRSMLQKRSGL